MVILEGCWWVVVVGCMCGVPKSPSRLSQRSALIQRVSVSSGEVQEASISPEVPWRPGHRAQAAVRAQGWALMNVSFLSSLNWDLPASSPRGNN